MKKLAGTNCFVKLELPLAQWTRRPPSLPALLLKDHAIFQDHGWLQAEACVQNTAGRCLGTACSLRLPLVHPRLAPLRKAPRCTPESDEALALLPC